VIHLTAAEAKKVFDLKIMEKLLKKTCTYESCKNKPEPLRKEVGYICIMLSFNHIHMAIMKTFTV